MGPCLCGDTACPSCGNPYQAAVEAAEEAAFDQLGGAKLSPEEYDLVVVVGLAAVEAARRESQRVISEVHAVQAEANEPTETKAESGRVTTLQRGADIPATGRHDAGAIARCSKCGRYTDNPSALDYDPRVKSQQDVRCDCGETHYWCGSFKRPTTDSVWCGTEPANATGGRDDG